VVVVEVVDPPDGHTSETETTLNRAGTNPDTDVPTGTSNTNPPTTCTRNTQPSATPTPGSTPKPATPTPAAASPIRSFRVLNTVACLSRLVACS
jgi:hypothetical protein